MSTVRVTFDARSSAGRTFMLACMILLFANACFLIPTKEKIYKSRLQDSQGRARLFGHIWDISNTLKENDDFIEFKEVRRDLMSRLQESGLDWVNTGSPISYQEIIDVVDSYATPGYLARLTPNDAWGFPYEFRVIEGILAVRSTGADGVFNKSVYFKESFPWLSGGDIVVVGGRELTQIDIPAPPDWFRLTPLPDKATEDADKS